MPDLTYLDHAASTPMRPEAVEAMIPFLADHFGNPSGAHSEARRARRAIDDARDSVAALVGCHPGEVVFTSGGTEADATAIAGTVGARPGPIVVGAIEHHAVLDAARALDGPHTPVTVVDVDRQGRIELDALRNTIPPQTLSGTTTDMSEVVPGSRPDRDRPQTLSGTTTQVSEVVPSSRGSLGGPGHPAVVSVAVTNNEVGTIQPLDELADLFAEHAPDAVLHTDAVQAAAWLDLTRLAARAHLVSLSAHKLGGPKGVGALIVRDGTPLAPLIRGGGQERGRRSGTPNVAGIVGFGAAARIVVAHGEITGERVAGLRDRLATELLASLRPLVPGVVETVVPDGRRDHILPGHLHLCLPGVAAEEVLFLLDQEGVAASAASSCASGAVEPSHVLAALGVPVEAVRGALRLTLGWSSTDVDVDRALEVIPAAVARVTKTRSHPHVEAVS